MLSSGGNRDPVFYQYEALGPQNSIRVLDLYPASTYSAPLHCGLREVILEAVDELVLDTRYEAVSYVWGSDEPCCEIYCDGKVIPITRSCDTVLRHLRRVHGHRTLWIDAVCINQAADGSSLEEKNVQVRQMDHVYEKATCVLVWLGDGFEPGIKKEIACLERYGESKDRLEKRLRNLPSPLIEPNAVEFIKSIFDNDDAAPESIYHQAIFTKEVVSTSPWYDRVWTIQEVAFAQRCEVLIGLEASLPDWTYVTIEWEILSKAIEVLQKANWWKLEDSRTIPLRNNLVDAMRSVDPMQKILLLQALEDVIGLKASDGRDMFYSLYSVLWRHRDWFADDFNGSIKFPTVDYNKDLRLVFMDATLLHLRCTKNLGMLRLVSRAENTTRLPSWVPDFAGANTKAVMRYRDAWRSRVLGHVKLREGADGSLHLLGRPIDLIASHSRKNFRRYYGVGDKRCRCRTPARCRACALCTENALALREWIHFSRNHFVAPEDYPSNDKWLLAVMAQSDVLIIVDLSHHKLFAACCESTETDPTELFAVGEKTMWITTQAPVPFDVDTTSFHRVNFFYALRSWCQNRALFVTASGYLGSTFYTVREGDVLVEIQGWHEPIVVRPAPGGGFTLVGPAFIPTSVPSETTQPQHYKSKLEYRESDAPWADVEWRWLSIY